MDRTRREALKAALWGALLAATPAELLRAAGSDDAASVELSDGTRLDHTPYGIVRVYRDGRRERVQEGSFRTIDQKSVVIHGGKIVGPDPVAEFSLNEGPVWVQGSSPFDKSTFVKEGPVWVNSSNQTAPAERVRPGAADLLRDRPELNPNATPQKNLQQKAR